MNDYLETLSQYAAGFDERLIADLVLALSPEQIELFRHYLAIAEQEVSLPN